MKSNYSFAVIRKRMFALKLRLLLLCGLCYSALFTNSVRAEQPESPSPYAQWPHGPSANADFFPIGVWLQNPTNAVRYKAAGINLYVGLWNGPTQSQLDVLEKVGMQVICQQNKIGLANKTNRIIAGWAQGDEPDNAQWAGRFGPPMKPEKVRNYYDEMRAADPSRPVLLNLGQGVARDSYLGRGIRKHHPEDYAEYTKACDIASFDIYPVVHDEAEITGKLEFVATGVERLVKWNSGKPVWNCIECTHINNPKIKATPAQVRAEVWMSLIHGSRGLIYFVHQFKPVFREAALLDDPEMLAAVTAINQQIRELAPVLNSATITNAVITQSSNPATPIATMVKHFNGDFYLFAAGMRASKTSGTFTFASLSKSASVEAIGESRGIPINDGKFSDEFTSYEVHLYKIKSKP